MKSKGDWLTTLALLLLGMYIDKQPGFEIDINPQLHDPRISYPHVPTQEQHVTPSNLWYFCTLFPMATITCVHLLKKQKHTHLANALLGLVASIAITLTVVCLPLPAVHVLLSDSSHPAMPRISAGA